MAAKRRGIALLTPEHVAEAEKRVAEAKLREEEKKRKKKERSGNEDEGKEEEEEPQANPRMEAGKKLPPRYQDIDDKFIAKPIQDIDEFYDDKNTFLVIGKDKTIFRFSAAKALFFMGPFHPVRRTFLYILVHPIFSTVVMLTILANCICMAAQLEIDSLELAFTVIYTCEGTIKILSRGFILAPFTYLRDMWNWLDFSVVSMAYVTMGVDLGNLSALRTFRVFRALKTVAVVPGLKTIVGALMEAVKRLRDVMILTVFMLSIFALIGLQLYQGALLSKCVRDIPPEYENITASLEQPWYKYKTRSDLAKLNPEVAEFILSHRNNISNVYIGGDWPIGKLCGSGDCPGGYVCTPSGGNPNYNYTNFDNFGSALLCSFRLMTQDYWENLYQLVLRASGRIHMIFFVFTMLLGSFYLLNLILAIVAMTYDEVQRQDKEDAEAELKELENNEEEDDMDEEAKEEAEAEFANSQLLKSPSGLSDVSIDAFVPPKTSNDDKDRLSIKSEDFGAIIMRRLSVGHLTRQTEKPCLSLPGSPFLRRSSQCSQLSFKRRKNKYVQKSGSQNRHPFMIIESLPFADDSTAVTPTSDDLCNTHINTHLPGQRRLSTSSHTKRQVDGRPHAGSRRGSFASRTLLSPPGDKLKDRSTEPQIFIWPTNATKGTHLLPEVIVDQTKSDDNESSSSAASEREIAKQKLFADNPFICRTPSATVMDIQDVKNLKNLIHNVESSTKRKKPISKREYIKAKCIQMYDDFECCGCWKIFSHYVNLFVMDAFVDLFITLCIVVNTAFMAADQYDMDPGMTATLVHGNYVFTTIFTLEAVLKIIALNPINYLKDKWNCFDICIVILSLVELALSGVKGLSILRSFRLLRVFKLAKSWPTLNLLIGIIGRTMGALGNLCFVLAIIVFIFAVMGMQLFGPNYTEFVHLFPGGTMPRWNFNDFLHSFMIVFRVLCGEWIESMWDCMLVNGVICVPFFLMSMIFANLVVLNLFLALLLASFGTESLQTNTDEEAEPNKLQEAVDRITRFVDWIKWHFTYCVKVKIRHQGMSLDSNDQTADPAFTKTDVSGKDIVDGDIPMRNGRICDSQEGETNDNNADEKDGRTLSIRLLKGSKNPHVAYTPVSPYEPDDVDKSISKDVNFNGKRPSMSSMSTTKVSKSPSNHSQMSKSHSVMSKMSKESANDSHHSNLSLSKDGSMDDKRIDANEQPEVNEVNVVFVQYPDDCCPGACTRRCGCIDRVARTNCGQKFLTYRCYMFTLVEHKYFESFIIFMIVASSLALAVEDVFLPERPILGKALEIMDKVFTVIFVLEMLIKWSAYGFAKYFTDAWCWLDFIIVGISLISLGAEQAGMGNIGAFRALRTLRALRPLRAVSRWEGMRVVVNALIQAIPSIANVMVVCLVFWLIFSIMGVQLFAGRFHRCEDQFGNRVDREIVPNREACINMTETHNYTWENADVNFDNVFGGYLCLFQVATFKGWTDIIANAVDSGEEDGDQPHREIRYGMYLYFVLFIVFGSFFTLNLFIGVIIENFNVQKKKAGGSLEMFMTEDQKRYYNAMKKLGSKAPQKPIPRPRLRCQAFFFDLTTNQKFDIAIMSVIVMNMFTMAIEHYNQDPSFEAAVNYINMVFIAIFTLECVMKLIGLRWFYFKQPWNVFDFVVVVLSILGLALADLFAKFFVSPTLLRVVRVFRVTRVLRLVKSAKGIRTLLFSLAVSIPALFNIGLLLFLVMFIFSIFGMSFFMYVKENAGINDFFNFQTFGNSMIILFQISTSAGWDSVLQGISISPPNCNATKTDIKPYGECGSRSMAIFFLISYLIITFLVIINMYIAVILENFSQATEDVQHGLTQEDFDMYYEVWERYDTEATTYIDLKDLEDFVDNLEEPLRLAAPNYLKIATLAIPICKDDKVHCVDILDALTKNFLGTSGTEIEGEVQPGQERVNYYPISDTLKRQREIWAAKKIGKMWREYAANNRNRERRPPREKKADEVVVDIESSEREGEGSEKIEEPPSYTAACDNQANDGGVAEAAPPVVDGKTVELYPESGVVA